MNIFQNNPYGINTTCERLQNNLALMDFNPRHLDLEPLEL